MPVVLFGIALTRVASGWIHYTVKPSYFCEFRIFAIEQLVANLQMHSQIHPLSYLTQNHNILRLQIAYRRQSEIISLWLIIDAVIDPLIGFQSVAHTWSESWNNQRSKLWFEKVFNEPCVDKVTWKNRSNAKFWSKLNKEHLKGTKLCSLIWRFLWRAREKSCDGCDQGRIPAYSSQAW